MMKKALIAFGVAIAATTLPVWAEQLVLLHTNDTDRKSVV